MPPRRLPDLALTYARRQRRESAAAGAAVARLWRRVSPDAIDASFGSARSQIVAVVERAQVGIAAGAASFVPEVMAAMGSTVADHGTVRAATFVGVTGDGRAVSSLVQHSTVLAKRMIGSGTAPPVAVNRAGLWLGKAVGTTLSDTGRGAERVAMAAHGATVYVRMLVPPSCSRCVVLAGRVYRDSTAFLRHPLCDCRHIPSAESLDGMQTDPRAYFDGLSTADQDRIFTAAGAEAIRSGADIGRVVNARRGLKSAQPGTTRTGFYGQTQRVRLMPESIQARAADRADYLRLLRTHGFLI